MGSEGGDLTAGWRCLWPVVGLQRGACVRRMWAVTSAAGGPVQWRKARYRYVYMLRAMQIDVFTFYNVSYTTLFVFWKIPDSPLTLVE